MTKAVSSIVISLLIAVGIFSGVASGAGVEDFTINDFAAEYKIDNSQTGGYLETTEDIEVTYSAYNHGILRALPKTYRGYDTKLKVLSVQRDGQPETYKIEDQGSNKVIRIGSANQTITGNHRYKIHYTQERIINFSEGKQSFYWDVNGNDWRQPFEKVSAKVLVKSASYGRQAPQCYTGSAYSQSKDCAISQSGQYQVFTTTKSLGPGENMSVEMFFDGQPFTQPTWKDRVADNAANIAGLVFGVIISMGAFAYWLKNGRDYGGRGVVVPIYEPPKGLTPAEVGMLADYGIQGRDISATIIDLAVRGYIKIHDDTRKVLFISKRQFSLELINDDLASLKPYEKSIIEGLLGTPLKKGVSISLSDVDKLKVHSAVEGLKSQIKKQLTDTYGLIEAKSLHKSGYFIVIGILLSFSLAFFHPNPGYIVGIITAGISFVLLGIVMPRRSHAGVEMYEQIQGLKLYMNTAEKDRLKMLQSVDRPYAEPSKSVELFEKLLPFAVALGVEKSWAKQFDGILTQPPSWYTGNNLSSFNAGYLATSLTTATRSFSSSMETSSGSSGGSGGGGGGGGGGGW